MIAVRLARPSDAAAMSAVLIASISELCADDHDKDPARIASWIANKTPQGISNMLAEPDLTMLVAELDGAVAAVGAFRGEAITLNYVAPWARFVGVSKALMAAMEAHLRNGGVQQARVTSTHTARPFYQAQGWSQDGAPVPCETGTGLRMVKAL